MAQIGNVPEIKAVKNHLEEMKNAGLIDEWEIPYEDVLTRLTAAIFFLTPKDDSKLEEIWRALEVHKMLQYKANETRMLSQLAWRVEFNKGFEL
jgi:hypothetical protein